MDSGQHSLACFDGGHLRLGKSIYKMGPRGDRYKLEDFSVDFSGGFLGILSDLPDRSLQGGSL